MSRLQVVTGLLILGASLGLLVFAINSDSGASAAPASPLEEASTELTDGQNTFEPTILNTNVPDTKPPAGMVWIPGGEFSMGSDSSAESICSLSGVTRDAVPIHRVYVDSF